MEREIDDSPPDIPRHPPEVEQDEDQHEPDDPGPQEDEDQREPDDPGTQEDGEQPKATVRGKV